MTKNIKLENVKVCKNLKGLEDYASKQHVPCSMFSFCFVFVVIETQNNKASKEELVSMVSYMQEDDFGTDTEEITLESSLDKSG